LSERDADGRAWHSDVTRYQWLVLVIASAGWMFDAFEGQVFNITRGQMLADLMGSESSTERVRMWGDTFLAIFLLGGTVGGLAFGSLADRYGRKRTLALTILFYSIFSGLTYFASELWHVAALRFLVALGVGGEWAVGATLVAEVFPARARARASGIFHATSVLGTWLAAAAGLAVGSEWRYAYIIGLLPALLVVWVRSSIHEPERWSVVVARAGARGSEHERACRAEARGSERRPGSFSELFGIARWAKPAALGLLLAAVGLGTFWGVTVAGQDLTQALLLRNGMAQGLAAERAKFAFGIVQTAGGGLGLLCFGPLAEWIGRRGAFALMHLMALAIVPAICYLPQTYGQMLCMLPVFGFCTLASHAGYAVYFPELFPDHLRATGTSVCFNGGRLLAAPILWLSGLIKGLPGMDLRHAVLILSSLFLVGLVLLIFLPETKGKPLPE
jgi:MFS family permease